MKYLTNIFSIMTVAIVTITLPSNKTKRALAIGCDTYYRVTGQIGGCSDVSTENARELWLKRYSACLKIQLAEEISIYKSKAEIYYAELDKNTEQNIRFEDIVLKDEDIPSLSLSQSQWATYSGNADFCEE